MRPGIKKFSQKVSASLSGRLRSGRRARRGNGWKYLPWVERLEAVQLMAAQMLNCYAVSGTVFLDNNGDGVLNQGDTAIAGNTLQLKNSAGVVVGTAVTDSNGAYSFSTDSTISTAPQTLTKSASVPATLTQDPPLVQTASVPQFDPALGTLTSVDVTVA